MSRPNQDTDKRVASRIQKELSDKTLEEFYQWAKEKGHYQSVSAVERFRRIEDE